MKGMTKLIVGMMAGATITAGASAAYASSSSPQPHTFGAPGSPAKLSANCSRLPMTLTPAGRTVADLKRFVFQVIAVQDSELKCEHRRLNRVIRCASKPLPTGDPAVSIWRKDDWKGVDRFQQFVDGWQAAQAAVDSCQAQVVGIR